MRDGIHPPYHKTRIVCSCGNVIDTHSTKKEMRVEVCSKCHPFYTGSTRVSVERGGQVEKFRKKYGV